MRDRGRFVFFAANAPFVSDPLDVQPLRAAGRGLRRFLLALLCCLLAVLWTLGVRIAGAEKIQLISEPQLEPERAEKALPPRPAAAVADTIWFADWGFGQPSCNASGWIAADNRVLNNGVVHWHLENSFGGQGGIVGQAAAVGYHGDLCCASPNGYDNDWYEAIRITYTGAATLSFDYLLDSEEGLDFLQVEADSACASFARVDYGTAPGTLAASFRQLVTSVSGLVQNGSVVNQSLPSYGPGTHCLYIAFFSDGGFSPCDGFQPTTIGEGVVVDNLSLTDAGGTRSEDFEDGSLDLGSFLNLQDSEPFGLWARLHQHASDNDFCGEVRDCAWIFTDPTLPALTPGMRFGPGGVVVRNWLDNVIVSPWVSLPPVGLGSAGTVLRFRYFAGNPYATSRIVQSFAVRTRRPAGSSECVSAWANMNWNSLSSFTWIETSRDLTTLVPAEASAIQIRYRLSDWQYISGVGPPSPFDPGPGPYLDRVRLGRRLLHGPQFGNDLGVEAQAQDNFPSVLASSVPVEDYVPSTDRFGASDFSPPSRHLGGSIGHTYFKTRDSLIVNVRDARGAGGLTGVRFNACIVAGPHAGKAPPPWTVGTNGFFQRPAEPKPFTADVWFADLDDRYFRGGDVMLYFWSATDADGGYASLPDGLSSEPSSVEAAETATGGLFEVSFLPAIDWDPAYLARIQADPYGNLEPTAAERAGSRQRDCILYQWISGLPQRRSGTANRTSFMYQLDHLGYAGAYDVYDQLGPPIANSQVMSRAALEVAGGYALIVVDAPNSGFVAVPPSGGLGFEGFLNQSQWYRDWLANATTGAAGRATLWLIGNDLVSHSVLKPGHVVAVEGATSIVAGFVAQGVHPLVVGQTGFTWADGTVSDFAPDEFALATGVCGQVPRVDLLGTTGTGVITHRYATGSGIGDGAVVMNANPAAAWNTVVMSFNWNWLASTDGTAASQVTQLTDVIVRAALADSCEHDPTPTGIPDLPGLDALPQRTALLPNVPNPFNPLTTIHFDLARDGPVQLRIHDVAGRVVRTLLEGQLGRRHHEIVWDGRDDSSRQVPSGVYLLRLHTVDGDWTRKLLALQ